MTREQFYQFALDEVLHYLPEDIITDDEFGLQFKECKRSDGTMYTGLTMTPPVVKVIGRQTIRPVANLDVAYDMYSGGECTKECFESIAMQLTSSVPEEVAFSRLNDWDYVKSRLFIRVVALDRVNTTVYRTIADDLAIIVSVMIGNDEDDGLFSTTVNEELLNVWDISKEELFNTAKAVSSKINPVHVSSLNEMFGYSDNEPPIIIVSDKTNYSAATLFYDGVLDEVADKIDSDLFVLPSSIHEFICIPTSLGFIINNLRDMVKDINENIVNPEDRLTDSVYRYDRDVKSFVKVM